MQVRSVQQVKFLRSSNNVESQLHFKLKLREAFTAKTIRRTVLISDSGVVHREHFSPFFVQHIVSEKRNPKIDLVNKYFL